MPGLEFHQPPENSTQHGLDSCVLIKDPLGIAVAAALADGSIAPVAAFSAAAALLTHGTPCMLAGSDAEDSGVLGVGALASVVACLLHCGRVLPLDTCQQRFLAAATAGDAGGAGDGPPRPASPGARACCARIIHCKGSPIAAAVLDTGAVAPYALRQGHRRSTADTALAKANV